MKDPDPREPGWDASPLMMFFVVLLAGILLAALLHFTGTVDFTAWR